MTDAEETTGGARGGRRDRRRERTRQVLLAAAVRLFGERGLYGTRVEDITEAADVAKGAFYNHFESKQALVAEVLLVAGQTLERDYLGSIGSTSTSEERVRAVIEGLERFFDENPAYLLVFHQARGMLTVDPASRGILGAAFERYLERLARHLAGDPQQSHTASEAAIVVAGAVAGSRSFGWAFASAPGKYRLADAMAAGVAAMIPGGAR